MMKNMEKYGEVIDARKTGYRSKNKIRKKPKANKGTPKAKRDTDSESDDDTAFLIDPEVLIDPCETVVPSEYELFAGSLPSGEYEIDLDNLVTSSPERMYQVYRSTMTGSSDRSDDELLDVILTSASALTDGSAE